jgi:geranylgeranyl pyrophosphate synthase
MMTLKEFQEWFNERFIELLEEKSDAFVMDSRNEAVREVLEHAAVLAEGGKRFRPYLVYVGYSVEGGEEDIFLLCAAVELLHLFCLVHDDVIDCEKERHGSATIHEHVEGLYASEKLGRAVAILLGDIVLAWAYECLEGMEAIEPYTIDDASADFRSAVSEVIHGQLLDVFSWVERDPTRELIENKMELKSARYSFFHPLYIGMLLAGADEEKQLFAEEYMVNIGMAYQLKDDLADCIEDMFDGQQTFVSWYMQNLASDDDKELFEICSRKGWSLVEEAILQKLLESSGALIWTAQKVEEYFLEAEDAIFNHERTSEGIWLELLDEVRNMR